jgi:hypothetical protein
MIGPDPDFATVYAVKQRRSWWTVRILAITLLLIAIGGILVMAAFATAVVVSIVNSFNILGELIAASILSLVILCYVFAICSLLMLLAAGQILEAIGLIVWLISAYFASR